MRKYLLLAQKTIRELRDKGVELDPVGDIEHIDRIMLASRRVDEPIDPEAARRAIAPTVMVGGVVLRALPYVAQEALQRVISSGLCAGMDEAIATAYACAHAQDSSLWMREVSPRAFLRDARRWARGVKASIVEIAAAVESLHTQEYSVLEKIGSGGERWGVHNMLETLRREYGKDEIYWLYTASLDDLCGLLYAIMQRVENQEREMAKQSKQKFLIDADSWSFRAMVALANERDRIAKEKAGGNVA